MQLASTGTFNNTARYAPSPSQVRGRWDTVDWTWLLIPAAVGLFLVRTVIIARKLKRAAANPTLADLRAFREAKRSLNGHRERLQEAVSNRRVHLEAAKSLSRVPSPRVREPESRLARMVERFAPDRKF